jgi:hypothetical protein
MRRTIVLGVGSSALLVSAFAQADEPWETGVVAPTLQLSGSTSGKGQISAGVDFLTSRGKTWDLFLNPSFTVANSGGVASILTVTSADGAKGPTQFSGSLSATIASMSTEPLNLDASLLAELTEARSRCLVYLGSPDALSDEKKFAESWFPFAAVWLLSNQEPEDGAVRQTLTTAINTKLATRYPGCTLAASPVRCQCSSPNKDCTREKADELAGEALSDAAKTCGGAEPATPICKWLKDSKRAAIPAPVDALCDAGGRYLRESKVTKQKIHELRKLLYPQHLFSFGATYGAAVFKYLEGTGSALKASSSTRSSVAGNVLYTYVQPATAARFTFELPLGFASTWTESTKIAYQCSPVGNLKGQSVETCEQTPMNEPTHALQLSGAALFGVAAVDESDLWRGAIGPVFMVDFAQGAKTTFQVGGEIPIYLSLTKSAGYEGDYEGMVRIMPTVVAEQTKDEKGVSTVGASFTLSVALLGKRKMFGSQLYWP